MLLPKATYTATGQDPIGRKIDIVEEANIIPKHIVEVIKDFYLMDMILLRIMS